MSNTMIINCPDEERMHIVFNGSTVGSFNHDEHGWSGMSAAEKLARNIARELGIEVVETFDEDE